MSNIWSTFTIWRANSRRIINQLFATGCISITEGIAWRCHNGNSLIRNLLPISFRIHPQHRRAACMRYRPNKMEVLFPLASGLCSVRKINGGRRGTPVITTQWRPLEKYGLAGWLLFMSNDVWHNTRHDSAPRLGCRRLLKLNPRALFAPVAL